MVTILECTAKDCFYNKSECCCKGDIEVKGHSAKCSSDTCCQSFKKQRDGSYSNAHTSSSPSRSVEIGCEADNCVYNDDHRCFADRIGIAGINASTSRETQCSTFRAR
ncbi:DUF1540 domain-containing protein [bacterium C-53]|nr:DUF1540 domain-containing protein [Lachnospiraceae bacterium]NBI04576.1 DUF1540 domain-containing protein [Lachnospiraceae bacterium]RKJ08063.1 DUF1540 domain-containing protein [bacterium C-53]